MDKQPCSISNSTSQGTTNWCHGWLLYPPALSPPVYPLNQPFVALTHIFTTQTYLYIRKQFSKKFQVDQGGRQAESTSADFWGVEGDEKGGRGLYTNSWMRWQLWMMPIWVEPYWSQNGCVYAGPEGSEWWKDNCKKTINYRIKFPHRILPGTWQTNFHISIIFLVGWERIKVNETT